MDDQRFFSIFDLGSSKIRIGVFDDALPNSKVCKEILYQSDLLGDENKFDTKKNSISELILSIEKETDQHLKSSSVMVDNKSTFSVDLSLKKKLDKISVNEILEKNLIQEAKTLIEKNYSNFKIIHILINEYTIDGKKFNEIPNEKKIDELVIEFKFILIPDYIINDLREIFRANQISISNIFVSSYIKSLDYINNFNNYDIKVFIDIGFDKTAFIIFKKNKLYHFNNIPIGGKHITKDISKILNLDFVKSEEIKKSLKQSNTILDNNENNDLLIKIIHARVEEIIDLSFKGIGNLDILKNKKSILIFTGEGSKILSRNSIYLKEDYNYFDDMNFFEENAEIISSAGYNYIVSEKKGEARIIPKTYKNRGFFEKLFYLLGK